MLEGKEEDGMNSQQSKIAIVFVAVLAGASPLHAQQQEPQGPSIGEVVEGVGSLFKRIFSSSPEPAKQAEPPAAPARVPASPPAAAPAPKAAAAAPGAAPTVVPVVTPAARVTARSLHEAVVGGDYDETARLLDQGASIEAKDPGSGASPLHYAVMKGRMKIIDLLLSRGADVNSRTRNGTTPLHTAALYARKEVAERLLEAKADVNAKSQSGATALALATAAKNWPIVEMLRAHGGK